tara:strand:+ start:1060 stop:1305 length:246 start_codon:yes stop_codon:yes gene_type:complete
MKKIIIGVVVLSTVSCTIGKITQKEIKINYELDKLYIEYIYKRDSLINEYNNTTLEKNKPTLKTSGVTKDGVIIKKEQIKD